MLAYINAHLREPITSRGIADAAGYSQYHAIRMFKDETGLSPFEYIRRERLVGSAHALREDGQKVLDVALDFVFDSHEGFTRAFSNAFGIAPKRFASVPAPSGWLIPYRYLDRKKLKSNVEETNLSDKTSVIFTQIIERPARRLILFRSKRASDYMEYCEEVGCGTPESPDPWSILSDIKQAIYEPIGVWLPENMRPEGTGVYAYAVEVPKSYDGEIPAGFDVIDLPPCQYLIFQGEPYDDERYCEAIGELWREIGKFNPEVYGYEYAEELAPRFQLAPMGWRGYIEGKPVRKIGR